MVILKEKKKEKKMRLHFPIPPFSPFWAGWKRWAWRNLITHILFLLFMRGISYSLFSFLSSQPNSRNRIPSLPFSSCHSKHSVNQTVKHFLPKVYKSIFYFFFNFKNELYSKYDRNDTNLKFMKLKSK